MPLAELDEVFDDPGHRDAARPDLGVGGVEIPAELGGQGGRDDAGFAEPLGPFAQGDVGDVVAAEDQVGDPGEGAGEAG